MAIIVKNSEQIKLMRISGEIVARTHEELEKAVRPGITTKELDEIANDYILSRGAVSSFYNYKGGMGSTGYPGHVCISINDEIIHGIPGLRVLKDGDIISIDIGVHLNGYHGDAARTHGVGHISKEAQKLIDVTRESFFKGMEAATHGGHLHDISAAIGDYAESFGFQMVREYVGHGVGKNLHEDPQIPNYRQPSRGPRLQKGMTLAVEPMVNEGTFEIKHLPDQWTVVTKDGKNSAHYENTILITEGKPELLTLV